MVREEAVTTFEAGKRLSDVLQSKSDLRLEIARLRHSLARSEAVAARHATLLREGDHRIKNSLQIVAGLMRVQARRESGSAREAFVSAVARIQSIARIHDALQASQGQDVVDIGAALETMCKSLQEMAGHPLGVTVRVSVEPIQAPVTLAQPLVLAVNELVVNALRHAFPDNRSGTIEVNVAQIDGDLRVVVADDGCGLPADHVEGRGYGMRLVRMMTTQIGGSLQIESGAGTRFTLTAPAARCGGRLLSPSSQARMGGS